MMSESRIIDCDELILYIDSYIRYQAMMRVQDLDENFNEALTTIIKANWNDVPARFERNSVVCAEHMVNTLYRRFDNDMTQE